MQDKVVAIAKWLRGKLAKAPAHKQPLHTQVGRPPPLGVGFCVVSVRRHELCSRKLISEPALMLTRCYCTCISHCRCALQYLPSALKDSGKRQLDCLGIATAVLAMCHHIALQSPAQHADLANTAMVVSDDHCLMVVGPDAGGPDAVFVEVTDPG